MTLPKASIDGRRKFGTNKLYLRSPNSIQRDTEDHAKCTAQELSFTFELVGHFAWPNALSGIDGQQNICCNFMIILHHLYNAGKDSREKTDFIRQIRNLDGTLERLRRWL